LLDYITFQFKIDDAYEFDFGHVCENDYECKTENSLVCYMGSCSYVSLF
jgi:hypothetical protein